MSQETKLFDHAFVSLREHPCKGKKDKSMFDTSKIPDIWDNLYYDLITHRPDLEPCR